jgi:hypothetical protein
MQSYKNSLTRYNDLIESKQIQPITQTQISLLGTLINPSQDRLQKSIDADFANVAELIELEII